MSVFVYRVPLRTTVIKSSVFLVFWRDVHIRGSSCSFFFQPCSSFFHSRVLTLPLFLLSLFRLFFCLPLPHVSCLSPFFFFLFLAYLDGRGRSIPLAFRSPELHAVPRYAKFRLACARHRLVQPVTTIIY